MTPVVSVNDCYPAAALHDGASHPLSTKYATLAAAQALYPFATALTQEIDFCACKRASNLAFGADGSENAASAHLNKRLHIPAGRYVFGNDTWLIRNLASGVIVGEGKLATILTGNNIVLGFDGLWYSELADFSIQCLTSSAATALDIDGNVPGHPYATRGVQGCTFRNLLVDGGNSANAVSMCRQGGSSGQGSECVFLNVHISSASFACYYQNGFNALSNTFFGGNFQGYGQNGIYVTGGTVGVFNTAFQSTTGYKQIENGGWDINVGSAGVFIGVPVIGCRTESLRFLNNDGAVAVDLRNCGQNVAVGGWVASTAYGPAAPSYKAIVEGGKLYVATTPGTTGTVKPTFSPAASPITDNTVVWTYTQFNMINNTTGNTDRRSLHVTAGDVYGTATWNIPVQVNANYTMNYVDDMVLCDCTGGAITVTPPTIGGTNNVDRGRQIIIKKTDTSANAVTIGPSAFEGGVSNLTLAGGARHAITLILGNATFGGPLAWLIANQF